MPVRIFVVAYGDAHLALLQQALCKSLMQKENLASLQSLQQNDAVVSLYSVQSSMDAAAGICAALGLVERHFIAPLDNPGRVQQLCILEEIQRCIDADAVMLMGCPDNVWGDGSVGNLLAIAGAETGVCVAVPHPRVDSAEFMLAWQTTDIWANSGLVTVAMDNLHPSWTHACLGYNWHGDQTTRASYAAGISWREIAGGLYAVTHLLPTVFLARFTKDDRDLFTAAIARGDVGIWDHVWPELLVRQGRLRTVGSSDAAFVAELTSADSHNVVLSPYDPTNPTAYHRTGAHISAGRGVVAVWRGA